MSDGHRAIRRFILRDVGVGDLILAARAAKHGLTMAGADAILTFGGVEEPVATFYLKRNKASITVRKMTNG